MKELVGSVVLIVLLIGGLCALMIWGDVQCSKQDAIDVRTMHPDWTESQIDAQSRIVHKGHQYRGSNSY